MAADGVPLVRDAVDHRGEKTGIEEELPLEVGSGDIDEPFNPEDIDVVTRTMTIGLLLSRIEFKAIDLHPDFQRRWGIWDTRRKSRLIESLLLEEFPFQHSMPPRTRMEIGRLLMEFRDFLQ